MTQKTIRKMKQFFSLMLVLVMMIGIITPGSATVVKAEDYDGYVYVTVERFTLGQGLAAEPKKIGYYEDESMADILARGFGDQLITSQGEWGASVDGFVDGGEPEGWSTEKIPQEIRDKVGTIGTRSKNGELLSGDYVSDAYLTQSIDNMSAGMGISSLVLDNDDEPDDSHYHNGSVFRISYTLYGWGSDVIGSSWNTPLITFANKDILIRGVVDFDGDKTGEVYKNAVEVLEDWDATQEEVDEAAYMLAATEKYETVYTSSLEAIKAGLANPEYGAEWSVLSIARSGLSDDDWNSFYTNNVGNSVKEKGTSVLDTSGWSYATENARVIIALNAAGGDPTNVEGFNLLEPLADYDKILGQGLNGVIFALIAFDTKGYDIPQLKDSKGNQTTKAKLIDGILSAQLQNGGWNYASYEDEKWTYYSEGADVDLTAMAIQSLAPYYSSSTKVKKAVDKGLEYLSSVQDKSGAFKNYANKLSCDSTAQVVCALAALGKNADSEELFVKENGSALDGLILFYIESEKAFKSTENDSEVNGYSNAQAVYALTAVNLLFSKNERLYMSKNHTHTKFELVNVKPNSCTEKGYTGDKVCVDCKEIVENGKEIAAKGHTPVEIPAIPATETTPGKTAGKKCSVCGEVIEAPKDIPATGKKEGPVQQTVEATPQFVSDGYEANGSKLTYKDDNDSTAKKLVIPATIKEDGKTYKVTKIAAGACKDNKNLTSVSVGKNVTSIGKNAFNGCSKLKTITIKGKVTSVGKNAFAGISKKATIKIKASKKQYKKTVKLIKKSGIPKTVKFKRV